MFSKELVFSGMQRFFMLRGQDRLRPIAGVYLREDMRYLCNKKDGDNRLADCLRAKHRDVIYATIFRLVMDFDPKI